MMRAALALASLAACFDTDATDPPWLLDHDRIVAVRATPPALLPGDIGLIDALVAHTGGPTTVEAVVGATAAFAPGDLFMAVHYNLDHWEIVGPSEARLDVARAELGLPPGAPVPLEVGLEFPGPHYAKKVVWLGAAHDNPSIDFAFGPSVRIGVDHPLELAVAPGWSVRWFASCGRIDDHASTSARLHIEAPCTGELALVVRDPYGGVAWQTLPLRTE